MTAINHMRDRDLLHIMAFVCSGLVGAGWLRMDVRKAKAAALRERAQQVHWIADMVKTDAARKILFQIAAEFEDEARQLEKVLNAEESKDATARSE